MKKDLYIISDAAKKVHVETHVLRYWEEELDISISRNEMGHRLYTEEDINLFLNIRSLKDHGFQLKAIKLLLPELSHKTEAEISSLFLLKDELNARAEEVCTTPATQDYSMYSKDEKLMVFERFISSIFEKALEKERHLMVSEMSKKIGDNVSEEVNDVLTKHLEKEEEHFRQLDAILRSHQKAIKEAAVTDIRKRKKQKLKKESKIKF